MQVAPNPSAASAAPPPDTREDWLGAVLEELDYGLVIVGPGAEVLHANHAARQESAAGHALEWSTGRLRTRSGRDQNLLDDALAAASRRGLRRLVGFGVEAERCSVSIVPLSADAADGPQPVLVVFGKRAVSEALSIEAWAREHGLTPAETRVLVALCGGRPPHAAAREMGVAISTVRSQIGSIRLKTGADSIRSLVRQVAMLPPIRSRLRPCAVVSAAISSW